MDGTTSPWCRLCDMRVAAVQVAPVYLDREATIGLVVDRIAEAADEVRPGSP